MAPGGPAERSAGADSPAAHFTRVRAGSREGSVTLAALRDEAWAGSARSFPLVGGGWARGLAGSAGSVRSREREMGR